MTKEDEKATIKALLEERRGYENRVRLAEEADNEEAVAEAKARVAAVDAQLRALGAGAKRAAPERRPARAQGVAKR